MTVMAHGPRQENGDLLLSMASRPALTQVKVEDTEVSVGYDDRHCSTSTVRAVVSHAAKQHEILSFERSHSLTGDAHVAALSN